uniref:Astacin domain-containing protein n=1 Tax=Strongyloides venezuelensis TaxID=75913 RepID=A0A0K0FS98_STRVS
MKKILIIILLFSLFITQCLIKAQKKPSLKTTKKTSVKRRPTTRKPTIKITTKKVIKPPTKTTARTTTKSTPKPTTIRIYTLRKIPPYAKDSIIYIYVPKTHYQKIAKIFGEISINAGVECLVNYRSPIKNKIGINFYEISKESNKLNISYDENIPTEVYLHKDDYQNTSRLLFYIGLSLGLITEFSTFDRQRYVEINYDNIKDDYKKYYDQIQGPITYRFSLFDFGSAMLSDQLFGSIDNKKPTYTFKYPYNKYQKLYDEKKTFSHNDYKHFTKFYSINNCSIDDNDCYNGGYIVNVCNQCICPSYFQGNRCKDLKISSGNCGFNRYSLATTELDFIAEKNLSGECYYTITASFGKRIKIVVETLILPNNKCSTDDDHLGILHRFDNGVEPLTICKNTTNLEIISETPKVYVHFKITKGPNLLVISFQEVDY